MVRARQSLPPEVAIADAVEGRKAPKEGYDFPTIDDGLAGIQQLAGDATLLFYMTEEAQHGRDAYKEKRKPDFRQFPKRP